MASHHDDHSSFGRRLASLRREVGLTRKQLADRAGVSEHLVQSLEQNRTRNPTLTTLLGLKRALAISFKELLDGVDTGAMLMETVPPEQVQPFVLEST